MIDLDKSFKTEEFLLGVCYYPEHWERSMWEEDFRRMKELGFNVVRMAETAWNILEPEEGAYCFELFDEAISLCQKYDLKVIMGTPTYAPPAWLTSKYPEVLRRTFDGVVMQHGSRRHYNYTSKIYHELSRKIVLALAQHYKDCPSVIGWQIDNELNCHMDVSFADSDHHAFRDWCKTKYETLDALNQAWGTAFWAQTYSDWEQVFLPRPTPTYHNTGLLLDFYRFTSDVTIAFARKQYDILKAHAPHQFVTHNGLFQNIDNYALTEQAVDFMSYDSYPAFQLSRKDLPSHFRDRMHGRNLSRVRGLSSKFMILEQQAGPGGQSGNVLNQYDFGDYLQPTPKPGQMRLWAWQSIAHGADGLLFFRWRTCTVGAESLWHGLNHYGNQPHRRLEEAGRLADEIAAVGKLMLRSKCAASAAILYDYDNDSNSKIEGYIGSEEWKSEEGIYQSLTERHLLTDMLPMQRSCKLAELQNYKVLFYPNAQLLESDDVHYLTQYVEQGGILVLGPRSGYKDRSNRCYMMPFPGVVKDLCGIEVIDFTMVKGHEDSYMKFAESDEIVTAPVFNEVLQVDSPTAEVIARYRTDYYKDRPAVVRHKVGKGEVIYCGMFFTKENTDQLLDLLHLTDPAEAWVYAPAEVEVVTRSHPDGEIVIFLNYTCSSQEIVFKEFVQDCITQNKLAGKIEIGPYGVVVVQRLQQRVFTS
ncbi:beta-galactosidase [Paenibacillus glycanilyticus]|uniref:Beta-galactosidase n=1 Tax=Paenibacillus glycanilyticus TaxID=126569 RepID=A0ABQ6G7Q3_9BACL|nr:beta-galactosidase [Paenibacillus glycanilyticus]GLX66988.1 beta-galactosidase [Paenibacillus glycanilyticus]